ncbi:hypothetical protein H9I32_10420 [Bacillus sp. Xin]|uniref:hypothetical protein n=1 Tax=unclassified Bacillus (in: firmicutes) TaxID=185979 RepID=UPI001572E35A|nr:MULTISPECIES: hypothetical protein [unclassified Bacillus (in: firmicutes)]MBC6972787.1 hypothetical protein [Bacillus sp. Xin]NSW39552.1 hypothetical protein [Bacillus sp. Xin1]
MKYEAIYTVVVSVGSEIVAKHDIKAHDIKEVIGNLSKKYLDKDKNVLDNLER